MPRPQLVLALPAVAAFLLSACGSSTPTATAVPPTRAPSAPATAVPSTSAPAATVTPAPTPSIPPTPTPGAAPSATSPTAAPPARTSLVQDFRLESFTILVGTKVTWTNNDATEHTVSSPGNFDGALDPKQSYSFTFTKAGTFKYTCQFYPDMQGTVTVQ